MSLKNARDSNEGLATLTRTLDHTRYYTGRSNQVNLRNSGPYQLQMPETYYRINRGFSVELGIPSVPTFETIESFIPEPDRRTTPSISSIRVFNAVREFRGEKS